MSRNRTRILSALVASVLAGASFGTASADDAHAKRTPTAVKKSKGDKRGDAGRSHRAARAAGRKVG